MATKTFITDALFLPTFPYKIMLRFGKLLTCLALKSAIQFSMVNNVRLKFRFVKLSSSIMPRNVVPLGTDKLSSSNAIYKFLRLL